MNENTNDMILEALKNAGERGLIIDELENGMSNRRVSPRLAELRRAGRVIQTEEMRITRHGRSAAVYCIAPPPKPRAFDDFNTAIKAFTQALSDADFSTSVIQSKAAYLSSVFQNAVITRDVALRRLEAKSLTQNVRSMYLSAINMFCEWMDGYEPMRQRLLDKSPKPSVKTSPRTQAPVKFEPINMGVVSLREKRILGADVELATNNLLLALRRARDSAWKTTSRTAAKLCVDKLIAIVED